MNRIKLLSIVVPSFRQAKTIEDNLKGISKILIKAKIPYEIILVIDGRVDKTLENAKKIKNKNIRIFEYEKNQGKGYAVKYGVLRARGDIIGFIDAGKDIDPESIIMLIKNFQQGNADIIVGSKLHPLSQVKYPLQRRIMSWGYRFFTKVLFGFKVNDTQVGIKIFKRSVAMKIFPLLLVKKFAFDIEVLAVAHDLGYKKIYEGPVKLAFSPNSITSGNFWKIVGHMMWDTLAVYYRLKILKHYKKVRDH